MLTRVDNGTTFCTVHNQQTYIVLEWNEKHLHFTAGVTVVLYWWFDYLFNKKSVQWMKKSWSFNLLIKAWETAHLPFREYFQWWWWKNWHLKVFVHQYVTLGSPKRFEIFNFLWSYFCFVWRNIVIQYQICGPNNCF